MARPSATSSRIEPRLDAGEQQRRAARPRPGATRPTISARCIAARTSASALDAGRQALEQQVLRRGLAALAEQLARPRGACALSSAGEQHGGAQQRRAAPSAPASVSAASAFSISGSLRFVGLRRAARRWRRRAARDRCENSFSAASAASSSRRMRLLLTTSSASSGSAASAPVAGIEGLAVAHDEHALAA